jgi:hypothetical protein
MKLICSLQMNPNAISIHSLFEFLRSGYANINYSNKLSPDLNEIEPYLDFIDKLISTIFTTTTAYFQGL